MNKLILNNLNVNKFYFNNKNINKLYLGKNLIYNNEIPEVPEVPEVSDLVSLGILPKQVSEYTNDDISSIISIPYTDESGKILLNNGCIEFEVVGVNHHKDINDESKPTITLMTKNRIRNASFDARELTNNDPERIDFGNNRWSVSNIRQWLNSEDAANKWFTSQHEYDEAPSDYVGDPGFLVGFSDEVKQHFATVKNKTILCNLDKSTLSKEFEETEDKVFLPSYTEMGYGDLDSSNPEGSHLAKKFTNNESRVKYGPGYWYLMRSPRHNITSNVYTVMDFGHCDYYDASDWSNTIAPLIVLC